MSNPQPVTFYIPIGVLETLEQIAPVRHVGHNHYLFGVKLSPNRTIPQDSWACLYDEGELVINKIKEETKNDEDI